MAALPYKDSDQGKKVQVEEMFDNISPKYDLLNHLLSANIDKIWRKKAVNRLRSSNPNRIIDIATGTGDFAVEATKIKNSKVTGIDISEGMLEVGRKKIQKKNLTQRIEFIKADSENLPFSDNTFDAALVGFGVRNFENLEKGLREISRVLKPGGAFVVLEFSKPRKSPFKEIYYFYFTKILPALGKIVSKDNRAYTYLPESVNEFPDGDNFLMILNKVGFNDAKAFPQTFGIATIYQSFKVKN
ncbi:bifunctional demethylmenaquinone methyltransferase/2-methoxy-6-polyprenyl-1,4-benzoquinol methylase UbiE [Maribellus comscasis]|uniref:Demethylmenaquinone methyltransferase n=1 Tax=Maribellus comscasis TaxID=2681766 RepID=A0A6I6JUI6_9BACT|nr:bifunctional demethylmenaquinone methyltransferase/2-methoxy-6-polyprenyl-1,4-benzoquinol methylase UbiE [Maribellus comscasis]QGY43103.1 bifunctional demethylmenaquinone methyltransferase/2-methoxy-6-polyprenyl-1,4-benzoquinol methylase UbiE [Maribellus comscasis]